MMALTYKCCIIKDLSQGIWVANMRLALLASLSVSALLASGGTSGTTGGGGGGVVAPPGTAEVRIFNEMSNVGGTVQMKAMFTQPHPISSGGGSFSLDQMSVDGVAISSPSGTSAGAALVNIRQGFLLCCLFFDIICL